MFALLNTISAHNKIYKIENRHLKQRNIRISFEVHVPSQESERSFISVLVISILSLSTIFLLDVGTVRQRGSFLLFILFPQHGITF